LSAGVDVKAILLLLLFLLFLMRHAGKLKRCFVSLYACAVHCVLENFLISSPFVAVWQLATGNWQLAANLARE